MSCPGAWVMLVSSNRTDLCKKSARVDSNNLAHMMLSTVVWECMKSWIGPRVAESTRCRRNNPALRGLIRWRFDPVVAGSTRWRFDPALERVDPLAD